MKTKSGRIKDQLPIVIILFFNFFTFCLFLFGPWKFKVDNLGLVIFFVLACLFLLLVGYKISLKKGITIDDSVCTRFNRFKKTDSVNLRFINLCVGFGMIIAIPDFLYNTRIFSLSFDVIWQRIVIGFTDSYNNYSESLSYVNSGSFGESLYVIINVLLYFFKFAVFPLCILYWGKLKRITKSACIFIETLEILKWIIRGMNKGVFDFVIILLASLIIKYFFHNSKKKNSSTINFFKVLGSFAVVVIVGIAAIAFFNANSISRSQTATISYFSSTTGLEADPENFSIAYLPNIYKRLTLSLSLYLTEGYQGLSYALHLPYNFNYFVGHNRFLSSNVEEMFGINVWEMSYMSRISNAYAWDSLVNWHSLYTWIANDIPFFLVPFVFLILGYLFGKAWKHSVRYRNPYAIVVTIILFIEFFYTSANNQIGAYAYTSVAFYIALIGWFLTKEKYKKYFTSVA